MQQTTLLVFSIFVTTSYCLRNLLAEDDIDWFEFGLSDLVRKQKDRIRVQDDDLILQICQINRLQDELNQAREHSRVLQEQWDASPAQIHAQYQNSFYIALATDALLGVITTIMMVKCCYNRNNPDNKKKRKGRFSHVIDLHETQTKKQRAFPQLQM